MAAVSESVCPGCGLRMPVREGAPCHGYYNCSPECWVLYSEVLAEEYSNAVLWGQVHQLTVDTYAVQHAGGSHPDKSVFIHLAGLHLVLERGMRPTAVAPLLQQLAQSVPAWPHFAPPEGPPRFTVFDVALEGGSDEGHIRAVREWSGAVWAAWAPYHGEVAALVASVMPPDEAEEDG